MKNLILEINKKHKFIQVVYMSKDNEYRRKIEMNELRLSEYFMYMIYEINTPDIYKRAL